MEESTLNNSALKEFNILYCLYTCITYKHADVKKKKKEKGTCHQAILINNMMHTVNVFVDPGKGRFLSHNIWPIVVNPRLLDPLCFNVGVKRCIWPRLQRKCRTLWVVRRHRSQIQQDPSCYDGGFITDLHCNWNVNIYLISIWFKWWNYIVNQ